MDKRFAPEVVTAAQASQAKWKVPASISLAQWAVESAYGTRMPPGSNNPFGIKDFSGKGVSTTTREVIGGVSKMMKQPFKRFASLAEAFDQHGRLLATSHYYVKAMAKISNPDAFARALTGVYATDPNYHTALIGVMKANDLYALNVPAALVPKVTVSREAIRALQSALIALGYGQVGDADGFVGPKTLSAVAAFEHDYQPRSAA